MNSRKRSQSGFTLLEVMVVVVLVGIIVTFATLSLDSGGLEREMQEEARRMQQLIRVAREEAILQTVELALLLEEDAYSFEVLQERKWAPVAGDKLLRRRPLHDGLTMEVSLEDLEFKLGEDKDDDSVRVLMLSSGEVTPFEVTLRADTLDVVYLVRSDGLGRTEIEGPVPVI